MNNDTKRTITVKEIGNFQVDEKTHKLYWNKKPIKMESSEFSRGQKIWAWCVSLAAILAALTTFNQEFCVVNLGKTCSVHVSGSDQNK